MKRNFIALSTAVACALTIAVAPANAQESSQPVFGAGSSGRSGSSVRSDADLAQFEAWKDQQTANPSKNLTSSVQSNEKMWNSEVLMSSFKEDYANKRPMGQTFEILLGILIFLLLVVRPSRA
ncbi:hypothetical protein [Corynebacterium aquatimens]|uniref:Secreted protein n=1 Tax=Corynebacterium aquatimens TaxID=1190508 RepID=A0A931DYJ0_9CORY|nr:hypothetical protein [Corynebacterium aquatimens]MBG6122732.1 hypothetical protein [Corynebacterium aquatimens]